MRLLLPLVVIAMMVALVVLAVMARRQLGRRDDPPALETVPWRVDHRSADGVTHIVVRRAAEGSGAVLDEREVATVRDDDPDFDAKFLEAMVLAHARADLFNAGES